MSLHVRVYEFDPHVPAAEQSVRSVVTTRAILVLGRGPHADVRFQDPSVSASHAVITRTKQGYVIEDTGSAAGTLVGGLPLRPRVGRLLPPFAEVRLGEIRVQVKKAVYLAGQWRCRDVALAILQRDLREREDFPMRLMLVEGAGMGGQCTVAARRRPMLIGSGPLCDVRLQGPEVAPEQVALRVDGQQVWIRNLSDEPLAIGGSRYARDQQGMWLTRDMMRIGQWVLALDDPLERMLREVESQA